jgi:hypothetical protein
MRTMHRSLLSLALICATAALLLASPATVRPVNDGATNAWTRDGGTACSSGTATCAARVNESSGATCTATPSDGDTSCITTSTNNAVQMFTVSLAGIPDGSTITAITIRSCTRKVPTQGDSFVHRYTLDGGTAVEGDSHTTAQTYGDFSHTFSSLSISKDGSTAIGIGVRSGAAREKRLSALAADITYTEPSGGRRRVVVAGLGGGR